ncbi:MAG: efflux RND transporter periplasmic adaptor subunit [Acetobacter sp.]|nr:efflux RND transporter periplasmic adaptor subunit [Acetobacter sp.]
MLSENSSSPSPYFYSQKWLLGSGVIAFLLAIVGIWFFLHTPAKKNRRHHAFIQPVAVQRVIRSNMPVILTELGTVIPITTVTVQTRISGYLLNVLFKEGQHVHKGEELATIDPRPYEVLLKQYEGQLARDRAQLEQARMDSARYQRLIKQDSIDAKTAQDQLFMVKQLEGTVKSDQALVDNEKLQILYCHITAPIDGRIGIRAVDKGNYVAAGQSGGLAILTQMQPISVIFTIPQNQLPEVLDELHAKKILPVEAWNSTNTAKIADGTTSVLDSEIDTSTGTVRMRAIFPNQDENLFPNQFVNAHLKLKTLKNVLLVPNVAVQTGPSGAFVYVVQANHTVKVQPVVTGISDATDTVILSGVTQGEEVVTDGTDHLRNGTKVMIPSEMPTQIKNHKTHHKRAHDSQHKTQQNTEN